MDPLWNEYDYITLRLNDENGYSEPCAYMPLAGLLDFWHALGVEDDAEDRLQPEWVKGNMVPVAPAFPVLSWIIQMQIDHSSINSADIPELIREISVGRKKCSNADGLAVFDALEVAAKLALAQAKGISLSPFG